MATTEIEISARISHLCDTEENWNTKSTFIPKKGELIVYEPDTNYTYPRAKLGDGVTLLKELHFITISEEVLNTLINNNKLQVSETQPSFACTWFHVTNK